MTVLEKFCQEGGASLKKKTKKVLIILACVLLALAVGGYFAYTAVMDYLGDKAMEMLVSNQLEGMLESGEITFEELEEIVISDTSSEAEPQTQHEEQETVTPTQEAEKPSPKPPEKKPAEEKKTAEKKETVKAASQKVTDSISREEKQAMMKLISSRLTKADITYLAGLAAGGLEGEEISKAYYLAKSRFTDAEIVQVKTYWHRYKSMVLKPTPKTEAETKK